jgi:hypothetical protein
MTKGISRWRSVAPAELQDVPWLTMPCDRLALLAALRRIISTDSDPSLSLGVI